MIGRNFDYGSQMSNSKEGEMAKRTLLTMAKDLHDLYTSLRSEDDLPSWCHYKLAKSQVELQSVTNYLTSKIAKMCIDNDIPEERLHLEIKNNLRDEYIAEGIFSFLKRNKNTSDTDARKHLRKMHNPSINNKNNYVNETIKFINLTTNMSSIINSISGDASYELDNKKVPLDSLNLLKIVRDECIKIHELLKPRKKFEPTITSARKQQQKKPWYKRLMFKEDYTVSAKNAFLRKLETLLDGVSPYFSKNVDTEKDVARIKQLTVYSEQEINTLVEDLDFTIQTLNSFISKEEGKKNDQFARSY